MNYNLLIDIGNSFSKIAVAENGEIVKEYRNEHSSLMSGIEEIFNQKGKAHIIIISDVKKIFGEKDLKGRYCDELIILNSSVGLPIGLDYKTPETLGADRIAGAVGAHSLFPGENCLIFDFGTAITIDVIDKNGRFSGGNISPGMSMRFHAMHHYTGSLPLVSPQDVRSLAGRETEEAINNGVVLGIVFEIENYINKYKDFRIIFTKKLNFTIFVVYNLVLRGLLKIAEFNDSEK